MTPLVVLMDYRRASLQGFVASAHNDTGTDLDLGVSDFTRE
jgi:hypothetical protein